MVKIGKHGKVVVEVPEVLVGGNYIEKPSFVGDAVKDRGVEVERHVRKRRGSLLTAYVGKNGSGKSATMVRDTLPDLLMGRPVLSTVALLDFDKNAETVEEADEAWSAIGAEEARPDDLLRLPHPCWIPFKNLGQIMTFEGPGVILMDEVSGIADARETSSLPWQVANQLFQLRRAQVALRWTTIDWSAADKRLRRITKAVVSCRGMLPKEIEGQVWTTNRLYVISMYEANGFDDFTSAANRVSEKQRPKVYSREFVRLHGGMSKAINAYSSAAGVLAPADAQGTGMCLDCGGRRSIPRCSCH